MCVNSLAIIPYPCPFPHPSPKWSVGNGIGYGYGYGRNLPAGSAQRDAELLELLGVDP
jgi:hypothetical protein